MPVEGVQSYNNNSSGRYTLSNVVGGSLLGVAGGLVTRQLVPLSTAERRSIPMREIINTARKETNRRMVKQFEDLDKRSVAEDRFIRMINDKAFKDKKKIQVELAKQGSGVADEFVKIIKVADRDSSAIARRIAVTYGKMIKGARPYLGYVLGGGLIGAFGGIVANMISGNKNNQSEQV